MRIDSEYVERFLSDLAGEQAPKIVRWIVKNPGKTDEQVGKKVKIPTNEVRAVLNKLYGYGIIRYNKEKAAKTNWYHYRWFVDKKRINELLLEKSKEELADLEAKLEQENNYVFFKCNNGCSRIPFEIAYEYDFKCPECGKEMVYVENKKEKKEIKEKIQELKSFLKKIKN
ncbi:MAG: hypothetical protein QW735_03155 [archaeon]